MNNISDLNKTIDEMMPETIQGFKSILEKSLQNTEQKIDYQSYPKNLFSEKNT